MQKTVFALTLLMVVFVSCTKEAVNSTAALQNIQSSTTTNAVAAAESSPTFTVTDNGDGTYTATLQPDATNGQDVHVNKRTDVDVSNSNFNFVPELDIAAWTINGYPEYLRAYLRFVDLAKIPATSKVLSATLYLYGESSSISSPQGDSYYPGSPYNAYGTNRCVIAPVDAPWDESTLTWNTQPNVRTDWGHASIPPSTSQWNYDVAITDIKGMVSRAVMFPAKNYGVRISLIDEQRYRNMVFASSESTDPTKRPKLVVVYK